MHGSASLPSSLQQGIIQPQMSTGLRLGALLQAKPTTAAMSPEGPEKWQSFSGFVEVTVLSEQGPSSQGALLKQSPPSFTNCFPMYLCVCVSLHPSGPQVQTWPS